MANKRMISKSIVKQDDFKRLSKEARLLYCLFNLYIDNDDFIGAPKSVTRMHCIEDVVIEELLINRYAVKYKHGIVVVTDRGIA